MSTSYRDLIVWQKSFNLVQEVYEYCKQIPRVEQYGLIDQIKRSSVSIPSNIAEGQQRDGPKEFIRFISIARGSAAELSTQLLLAQEIFKVDATQLLIKLEEIQKMLYSLKNRL